MRSMSQEISAPQSGAEAPKESEDQRNERAQRERKLAEVVKMLRGKYLKAQQNTKEIKATE